MTEYFEQLFRAMKRLALSTREREVMRNALRLYMREHTAHAPFLVRMRYSISAVLARQRLTMHPAFVASILVLCIGVGTSYAAEGALPGDALYPVKTLLNERVQGALALSTIQKAEWSVELTSRRLEEAEELAVTGKLSSVASADIEARIDDAATGFDANVALLARNDQNENVAGLQSDYEASLSAHETVLASLGASSSSVERSLSPLISRVRVHADRITRARYDSETALAARSDASLKKAALGKKKMPRRKCKRMPR